MPYTDPIIQEEALTEYRSIAVYMGRHGSMAVRFQDFCAWVAGGFRPPVADRGKHHNESNQDGESQSMSEVGDHEDLNA